jgi:hypothetical protein
MRRDVVVVGGSAGSHRPLMQALARLPSDLPAMVLVALRIAPGARAELADSLVKSCALPAVDGVRFEPGCVHAAVPDRHLIVPSGSLDDGAAGLAVIAAEGGALWRPSRRSRATGIGEPVRRWPEHSRSGCLRT